MPEPVDTMAPLHFAKMNGIGNSILVLDLRGRRAPLSADAARRLGATPGLHFDQLMAIEPPRRPGTDAYVDIFNIDGSRSGTCGNGTRCIAWYLLRGESRDALLVETAGGLLPCRRLGPETFSVDMGPPRFGWRDIPLRDPVVDATAVTLPAPPAPALARFSAVSMGNPHAIFFVADADAIPLASVGPAIEHDPFFPERVNASFAQVLSRDAIKLRVWERGAGATLACGSAACATLVAGARAGLTARQARIDLPGGSLEVTWRADDHVVMTGGIELEHEGVLPPGALEAAA
jgi:diaminopimelate epimerase